MAQQGVEKLNWLGTFKVNHHRFVVGVCPRPSRGVMPIIGSKQVKSHSEEFCCRRFGTRGITQHVLWES